MKNKQIDQINKVMSKRHGIFSKKFTILFQMQENLETYRNLNLINFKRPSFGDYKIAIFIS